MIGLKSINPVRYIKNMEEFQNQKCSRCFQFKLEMRRCSGPCKKNICVLCMARQRFGMCQFCNEKLTLQNAQFSQIIFCCPSNSNQCNAQLSSSKQFLAHSSKCALVDEELRKQFEYKISYRCKCGHPLKFKGKKQCHECDLDYGARSQCQKCRIQFCTMCRLPPCSKQMCMNGHQLLMQRQGSATCDLCKLSISSLSRVKIYSDRPCDFDVCIFCYEKLDQGKQKLSSLQQKHLESMGSPLSLR